MMSGEVNLWPVEGVGGRLQGCRTQGLALRRIRRLGKPQVDGKRCDNIRFTVFPKSACERPLMAESGLSPASSSPY